MICLVTHIVFNHHKEGDMRQINELAKILKGPFPIDKRRVTFLAQVVLGLLQVCSVNLTQLALGVATNQQASSAYRRLRRLLSDLDVCPERIGCWLLSWFLPADEPLYLAIDRTNWQWGKANINFLVIAVPYKRMAIPVAWALLPKKGNSNPGERTVLLERLFRYLPKSRVQGILADREFVGKDWWHWLAAQELPFFIRVKDNLRVTRGRGGKGTLIRRLFEGLPRGHRQRLRDTYHVLGQKVTLTGSRLISGELMVIASSHRDRCAITAYLERWEIETLFENLKSRGFDLEATHLTDLKKLERLLTLVAMAACWAYRVGEWRIEQGELIQLKTHGRPSVSLFRHGLDALRLPLLRMTGWRSWKPLLQLWRELTTPTPLLAL